jgi:hypothetical protein
MRVAVAVLLLAAAAAAQSSSAKVTHIWGRIESISKSGFSVVQNFDADPQSGYRRGNRRIILNSDTKFEDSARQDLRIGRTVDIIGLNAAGLKAADSAVQATRVIVYEGNHPVRMPGGARVIAPNGSIQTSR